MSAMMVINVHPDCSKLTPGINADELITIPNLSIHTFTPDLFIPRNLFAFYLEKNREVKDTFPLLLVLSGGECVLNNNYIPLLKSHNILKNHHIESQFKLQANIPF